MTTLNQVGNIVRERAKSTTEDAVRLGKAAGMTGLMISAHASVVSADAVANVAIKGADKLNGWATMFANKVIARQR